MNAHVLLSELVRLGVHLDAHGDRLRVSPRSAVGPDLLARIVQHKAGLLQLLAPEPVDAEGASDAEPAGPEPPADLIRCPWCGGTDLADDQTGAWCRRCARLGWHYQPDGAVRADADDPEAAASTTSFSYGANLANIRGLVDCQPKPKPRRRVRRPGPEPIGWPAAAADFALLLQPDERQILLPDSASNRRLSGPLEAPGSSVTSAGGGQRPGAPGDHQGVIRAPGGRPAG